MSYFLARPAEGDIAPRHGRSPLVQPDAAVYLSHTPFDISLSLVCIQSRKLEKTVSLKTGTKVYVTHSGKYEPRKSSFPLHHVSWDVGRQHAPSGV